MILKERKKFEEFFKILISELNNVYHQEDEINVRKLEMMFEFIRYGMRNYANECKNCRVQIKKDLNNLTNYYLIKYRETIYMIGDVNSYKNGLFKVLRFNNNKDLLVSGIDKDVKIYEINKNINENIIPSLYDVIEYYKIKSMENDFYYFDTGVKQMIEEGLSAEDIKRTLNYILSKYENDNQNRKTPKK